MAKDDLERRFGDAAQELGFNLIADGLHGPPAIEDLLADVNVDADAPIRALTSLCGTGDADADASTMTRFLLDLGIDPEDAAWAARVWTHTRDGRAAGAYQDALTDPEPGPPTPTDSGESAAAAADRPMPSGTVALLFTDIEGSTRRWADGATEMGSALERHDTLLRTNIEAHHGVVFTTSGDAFCAAFSQVGEAVTAAVALQQELAAADFSETGGLPVRMAIHVGAVETRDGDYYGLELSRVARILGHGHGGQIILSEAASTQVPIAQQRQLGQVILRDFPRPELVHQLLGPGLRDNFPPLLVQTIPTRIPQRPTSFIGRRPLVESIATLVRQHRLVTLLGTGGLGKTRLAIEVATLESDRRPVVVCELAPATDRAALEGQVHADLGAESGSRGEVLDLICDVIGPNDLLLVLDNCEQIVGEVADFTEHVMQRCANVTILATSREVLEVPGERIVRVEGLHESDLGAAVELFLARASEAGVQASSLDRSIIEDLCMHLDGLPLAIELAAAKTALLPLSEIHAGLDNRLDLLKHRGRRGGGRHSSLRTMLDWSWELLDDEIRLSLAQLAAFASGFSIDAAAMVLDRNQGLALNSLEELLARSLIVREPDTVPARYRMLESVREYATEKAQELGVRTGARTRHLEWVAATAGAAGTEIADGATAAAAMQRLDREQHEIAAALDFAAADGDAMVALQTVIHLWDWWRARLRLAEGINRIEALLARVDPDAPDPAVAGALVVRADFMRMLHGTDERVIAAIREARPTLGLVSDEVVANRYRLRLVLAEFDDEDESIADELWSLVEAARAAGTTEDTMGLHMLTALAQRRDSEESLRLARETLSTAQAHHNVVAAAHARELIAIALTDLGRTAEARVALANAVHALNAANQPGCMLHCAESVAWYLYRSGGERQAESLYAAAIGLRQRLRRQRAGFEVHAARQLLAHLGQDPEPDEHKDIDDLVLTMQTVIAE